MPPTGRLVERWGSPRLSWAGGALTFGALALPFLSPSLGWLLLAMLTLGLCNSVLDVALSAQGVTAEKAASRPLMSRLHAFYSLGGLAGALSGAMLVGHIPMPQHVGGTVAFCLALTLWAGPRLLPEPTPDPGETGAQASQRQSPPRIAYALGALCFLGMLTEGTNYDWAAIYYRDILHAQAGATAWGYGAFTGTMALGRWWGDRLRAWSGNLWAVRGGALLAALGLTLALTVPQPMAATLGFALSGLGLSNVVMYSSAGHALAGRGIAAVASIGYAGFLPGPPVIGFLSDHLGLRLALGVAALGALLVSLFAGPVLGQLEESSV